MRTSAAGMPERAGWRNPPMGSTLASMDEVTDGSTEAPNSNRRRFVKRLGVAALGAAAAAPVVGATSAQAGTSPAYTDDPNTFTQDQTVLANLSVGGAAQAPLTVISKTPGPAVAIAAHTMALGAGHNQDWGDATYDLVNLRHKSCGDAIFIAH